MNLGITISEYELHSTVQWKILVCSKSLQQIIQPIDLVIAMMFYSCNIYNLVLDEFDDVCFV
jgi:hypothetical protein